MQPFEAVQFVLHLIVHHADSFGPITVPITQTGHIALTGTAEILVLLTGFYLAVGVGAIALQRLYENTRPFA